MDRTATIAIALAVGLAAGIPLGGRLMPSPAGSAGPARASSAAFAAVPGAIGDAGRLGAVRSRARLAEGSQHAPGSREVDLRRCPGHLRREPESRLLVERRRTAEPAAARHQAVPRDRPQRAVPVGGPAMAQREHGGAAGGWRVGFGSGEGNGDVEGRRAARIGSSASMPAGSIASSSSTRRATSSRSGRSGTSSSSARTRSTSAPTIRRSTCGSSTTTCTPSTSSPTTASSSCRRLARRPFGRRCHALQPADVHGLAARRQLLRLRRLQRHARRQVRRAGQVPAGLRHEG